MSFVIGSGDIAQALEQVDRPDLLFFASGVSNSRCTDEKEYKREMDLLLEQPRDAHIVYFSSLGVFDGSSRYYHHKLAMELLVEKEFHPYTIVRLGNIDWGDNPYTLINYLRAHPEAEIRDEYRYILGKDEFIHWVNRIPAWSCEMNCTGKLMKVQEVHDVYVRAYSQKV